MKTYPWLATTLSLALAPPLLAAPAISADQLGQARPAAPDVSRSPNWHVYRFQRQGVDYLQVNDLDDQPRMAVAAAKSSVLVLPIGSDAGQVQVQCGCNKQILASNHLNPLSTTEDAATPVYRDAQVQIKAVPGPGGESWQVETLEAP